MNILQDPEVDKIWHRVPLPVWLLMLFSSWIVVSDLRLAMQQTSAEQPFWSALVFPVVLGGVLSLRILPRYWLAFAWAGVGGFMAALLCSSLNSVEAIPSTYQVLASLSLLFLTQSAVLSVRRWRELKQHQA